MTKHPDRDSDYMKKMWGTSELTTDYGSLSNKKMLREIVNDNQTPKKHNFQIQSELHQKIRNDEDYDDWNYGAEPIPLTEF